MRNNLFNLQMQIEFGLPDQAGRQKILNIYTSELKENNMLGEDVDLLVRTPCVHLFLSYGFKGFI